MPPIAQISREAGNDGRMSPFSSVFFFRYEANERFDVIRIFREHHNRRLHFENACVVAVVTPCFIVRAYVALYPLFNFCCEIECHKYYFISVPGGTSRSGAKSTGPLSFAARSMPFDSIPIIVLGSRFRTTTISRPANKAGSYAFPIPAMSVCVPSPTP